MAAVNLKASLIDTIICGLATLLPAAVTSTYATIKAAATDELVIFESCLLANPNTNGPVYVTVAVFLSGSPVSYVCQNRQVPKALRKDEAINILENKSLWLPEGYSLQIKTESVPSGGTGPSVTAPYTTVKNA